MASRADQSPGHILLAGDWHGNRDWALNVGRVPVRPNIHHLPRGFRWDGHGRTWLACGGGVSLDKAARAEGLDSWPDEEITSGQESAFVAGTHAEVMVSHDCPSSVAHTFPRPPPEWAPADLARHEAHREQPQRIVAPVRPSHLIHGHLHPASQRTPHFSYAPLHPPPLPPHGSLRTF